MQKDSGGLMGVCLGRGGGRPIRAHELTGKVAEASRDVPNQYVQAALLLFLAGTMDTYLPPCFLALVEKDTILQCLTAAPAVGGVGVQVKQLLRYRFFQWRNPKPG